jgi:hypothetical protein
MEAEGHSGYCYCLTDKWVLVTRWNLRRVDEALFSLYLLFWACLERSGNKQNDEIIALNIINCDDCKL